MRIPVYYVLDRGINDPDRCEALWSIETVATFAKLVGKKLGLRKTDGQYLTGWLQEMPDDSVEVCLLEESNWSQKIRIRLETIQAVEIIQRADDSPVPKANRSRGKKRLQKQPQAAQDVTVKKCVHGRNPMFCCDCSYTQ